MSLLFSDEMNSSNKFTTHFNLLIILPHEKNNKKLSVRQSERENVYFMCFSFPLTHPKAKKGSVISFIDFLCSLISLFQLEPSVFLLHPPPSDFSIIENLLMIFFTYAYESFVKALKKFG